MLSAFGEFLAADGGSELSKVDAAIMSGEDTGDAWQCQDPEVLTFLRTFDDPGRRVAAHGLLGIAPFTFETTFAGCDAYFRYLPATFPNHDLVVAWEAAPPHQESGFAIVSERPQAKAKRQPQPKKKAKKRPTVKAKGGAKRSSPARRASRRKPPRRR